MSEIVHSGKASSFADPADVAAFHKWFKIYRDKGYGPERATKLSFAKGDNAVGAWGDSTAEGSGPSCALSPDDIREKWLSLSVGKHKPVVVTLNGHTFTCILKDTMPPNDRKLNPAIIDLNPDAIALAGLRPPIMHDCTWSWA